ncbi:MAG: hypothetical protein AB7O39_03375 [Flavobacteriaceae bacterium]
MDKKMANDGGAELLVAANRKLLADWDKRNWLRFLERLDRAALAQQERKP